MERPVRKTVDREYVAAFPVEPAPELGQGARLGQLARRLVAQPQADAVRLARMANPVPHRKGVRAERREGFRPRFAAVDVGAVGEVQTVGEAHVAGKVAQNAIGYRIGWRNGPQNT